MDGKTLTPLEMSIISERSEEKASERCQVDDLLKDTTPVLEMDFWKDPKPIKEVS